MKQELHLTGPCGGTLLGFLTVIGAATVLVRQGHEVELCWVWRSGQWLGCLRGDIPADVPGLAAKVHDGLVASLQGHPLGFSCLPDAERALRAAAYPEKAEERAPAYPGGMGALLATTEAWTPWYQLVRRDHWEGVLERTLARVTVGHLERALSGPWDFGDPVAGFGLRLSPTENRRYGRQWHAPTTDPGRGQWGAMLGANRLALESYTWWDALCTGDGLAQVGWQRRPGGAQWTWALWRGWLPSATWRTVFSLASLQTLDVTDQHRQDWAALGLLAVCRVRRILHEQTLLFLPPDYLHVVTGD